MSINKINVFSTCSVAKPNNVIKKTLPLTGGLSVLAGSSMGATYIPDAPHVSGSSVTDPFADQLVYAGGMLLDTGSAIGDAAMHGISSLGGVALDAGCVVADRVSDLGDQALDALEKILDTIG